MNIPTTKLYIGTTASGKTTKCIQHAANALWLGKSVLFVNDEGYKEDLMGRIGERLFTLNTHVFKNIPNIKIAVTSNKDENYYTGAKFDVVIVDCFGEVNYNFFRSLAVQEYYETRQASKDLFFN